MEASEESIRNSLISFFEHQVSKTGIFSHRKNLSESSKKIELLRKQKENPKKEAKKLEKLLKEHEELDRETSRMREYAINVEIPKWLDETAEKGLKVRDGKSSRKSTHLLKFTHSSSKHLSVCVSTRRNFDDNLLHTESISESYFDISHSNGAFITVSKFLLLKIGDDLVIDKILNNDFSFLEAIKSSPERTEAWKLGLSNFVTTTPLKDVARAKQMFFPYGNGYHLIAPLFSSSLSETLNNQIKSFRNDEKFRSARKARKSSKYSDYIDTSIPQTAIQHFGGEHPQNVSPLNFGRSGNSLLVSCQPPEWQTQHKPPLTQFAFWRRYTRAALPTVKRMVKYLKSVKDFNNIDVRDTRQSYTDDLIEKFILIGAEIRDLRAEAGWSAHSSISDAEKYLLDPERSDAEFQAAREESDWQNDLADQYATWLNRQLRYYKIKAAATEHSTWRKEAKEALRENLEGFGV